MTNGQAGGQPVYILREGTARSKGREAQYYNIMAALAVAEAVRSTLGPKGMDKMLVDSMGTSVVTNDGATILKEIDIEHPAAKMIVEVAKTQDDEVGDGTTTAVIIAGELLKKAGELMEQDIHPAVMSAGYRLAAAKAMDILKSMATQVKKDDRKMLKFIAFTAITGKGAESIGDVMSDIAVDAVMSVEENGEADIDNIKVEKKAGAGAMASSMIKGIVLSKSRATDDMPKTVKNAKILLLNAPMEIKKTEVTSSIKITSPMQMQTFLAKEEAMLRKKVDLIKASGANVVFSQKSIDNLVEFYLAKEGILAFKSVSESDMKKLNKAVGGRTVTKLEEVDAKDLGFAGLIDERRMGDDSFTFVEGCKNPKAVTVLLRGGTDTVLDELERALHDALKVVSVIIKDGYIVPGGAAPEIELALRLREYSSKVGGREQLAVEAFANAMEIIPRTLAENAGLDPIDTLVELRHKHETKGGKNFGLNVYTGKPEDMIKQGVIEPLRVKTQAINSAVEAAVMILRIDDVIASAGPSEQDVAEAQMQAQSQLAQMRGMGGMGGMGGMM